MSISTSLPAPEPAPGDRSAIGDAQRIVVKIGSSSLTKPDGHIDEDRIVEVSRVIAEQRARGRQIVLVSSGGIASAIGPLNLGSRPKELALQQAASSVGQGLLLERYNRAFAKHDTLVGQVLLTEADVVRSGQYKNARRALNALLELGVMPIVNENDAVASDEIRFGDNDRLAALVAHLISAEVLVLLSDVDALYDAPPSSPGSTRIEVVPDVAELKGIEIGSAGSGVGTGGMVTKLEAASIASTSGVATLLTSAENIEPALLGEDVGTFFPAVTGRKSSRLLWLRHAAKGGGRIVVDQGAADALTKGGKSLLAVGATGVEGSFTAASPVDIVGPKGDVLARGIARFSAEELRPMLGRSTASIRQHVGPHFARSIVHRDDLVLITRRGTSRR